MNMAIQLTAALFLIVWATQLKVEKSSGLLFKFLWSTMPAILSFALVLTAFKVI